MATHNSEQYNAGIATLGSGPAGTVKMLTGTLEIGTIHTIGDTVNFFVAPKGFTPVFGWLVGDDLDTGTEALEIDVGITGDTTKYLNSGVITGDTIANEKITVGIKIPLQEDLMTVKPTPFTSNTTVIGTVTAAAATGGTGTLTLIMCGLYNEQL